MRPPPGCLHSNTLRISPAMWLGCRTCESVYARITLRGQRLISFGLILLLFVLPSGWMSGWLALISIPVATQECYAMVLPYDMRHATAVSVLQSHVHSGCVQKCFRTVTRCQHIFDIRYRALHIPSSPCRSSMRGWQRKTLSCNQHRAAEIPSIPRQSNHSLLEIQY